MKVVKYLKIMVAVAFSICLLGGCTSKSDIEDATKDIIVESLNKNDALREIVAIDGVESCTLVKESDTKYTGVAAVKFRIKKDGSSFTATYDVEVLYDGDMVLLNNAEMEDQDWLKMLERAGLSADATEE